MQKVAWIALGIFCCLHGFFAVTNVKVVWGPEIEGFSALVAGILILLCYARP